MFEFIRTHQRLMQIFLAVLIVPSFVLVGISSYKGFGGNSDAIATVGGQPVTQQEFDKALRDQTDRLRQTYGPQFDPKMLETPEARQNILDNLIAQRAIDAEITKRHLTVSDEALAKFYRENIKDDLGNFDVARYQAIAAQQGLTTQGLDQMVRRQLLSQQFAAGVEATSFAPRTVANRLADITQQEREAQEMLFPAANYVSQVKVTDDMVKAYYDKNAALFQVPEQAKIEYVVFDGAAVEGQVTVSDAEIADFYNKNIARFKSGEQRRASHILILVKKDGSAAEKAAAKAKAEAILAEVKKNPADFAKLAKTNSQDPGSAEQGGDLGVVEKGAFVKPVEDSIYALKQGEISNLVESEYGYHIITVTDIKAAGQRTLEEAKPEIATELKKQKMSKKYSELAEAFGNTVYEQADSLKPVADKLKLTVQTADGVTRNPNPAAQGAPWNNPKFLKALFTDDVIKNKRNTEAVEVAPSTLVAGRIVDFKPATKKPLAEVADVIRQRVTQEEATRLAKAAGEAKLAAVKASGDATGFGEAKIVTRTKEPPFVPAAAMAVMKADTSKLPAYVGVELPGTGYGVYRINKVQQPAEQDPARRQGLAQQIGAAIGQQEMYGYIEALKHKAKTKVNHAPATAQQQGAPQ
ncbi:peptidylprolyl isomerase [Massilia arenosa]|uniref:Periplasmic chaperone PpiD n=1 Tax=Zemynaea arenosa TaxID=2561931 RepID=A0A4Y9RQ87_9BURK|nr:SurA N-terminal domain-containing protein [Massilia arenosa]TFW11497.1 peptidylprolyl isomerase [Massilia arenosa]